MWALVATAAAGLEAGHGLAAVIKHNALLESGVPEYLAVFPKTSTVSATASSTLSALATGASLAAYFSENEVNRDPAWLTAALLAGLPLVYGMLVLAPAKIAIDNSGGMSDLKERESNLRAWGVKKYIGFALTLVPFAGMLLVLSAERDERSVGGVKF